MKSIGSGLVMTLTTPPEARPYCGSKLLVVMQYYCTSSKGTVTLGSGNVRVDILNTIQEDLCTAGSLAVERVAHAARRFVLIPGHFCRAALRYLVT
jgi:hypothetical protein